MVKPNARQAAIITFGPIAGQRLDKGLCPRCGRKPSDFRDDVSRKEHLITGLCQPCQDFIFKEIEED